MTRNPIETTIQTKTRTVGPHITYYYLRHRKSLQSKVRTHKSK